MSPLITITDLHKTYKGKPAVEALKGVSLSIEKGSIYGLLGPNGAGKTTLVSILNGLTTPSKGSISLFDMPLCTKNLKTIRSKIALIPQHLAFYDDLTVAENLVYFAGVLNLRGTQRKTQIEAVLSINTLEGSLHKKAKILSGGQKRRLNIAIGLLSNPEIIFFDEPTVGIDPEARGQILESIQRLAQEGATVIYTSHYMNEIEKICDRVAIIHEGHIVKEGSLQKLLSHDNALSITISARPMAQLTHILQPCKQAAATSSTEITMNSKKAVHMAALLTLLETESIDIKNINYVSHDLEALFLSLTQSSRSRTC